MKFENMNVSIRDVQKVQLEILLEFDRVCKKNAIQYQLFAGTLLGAIRHKGFIPWDDDIDVCMLRKDYDKFIKLGKKELSDSYFLQTHKSDKDYIMSFAKIRKNNTLFIEESTSESKIHSGIYIDVFPMDNVQPGKMLGIMQQKTLFVLGRINLSRIKKISLQATKPIEKYVSLGFHYILKLIPKAWTNYLLDKLLIMFNDRETEYVTHLSNGVSRSRYFRYIQRKDEVYNTINGEFEGCYFPIPAQYEDDLTRLFGDYMKLPPIEQQKPHHGIIEVNFDTKRSKKV